MPFTVTKYESTPNPNAIKCWLDKPISEQPRSFLNKQMASSDPVASDLFEHAQATCVLMNGDWVTVNKPPDAQWTAVKKAIESVLQQAADR